MRGNRQRHAHQDFAFMNGYGYFSQFEDYAVSTAAKWHPALNLRYMSIEIIFFLLRLIPLNFGSVRLLSGSDVR